MGVSCEGILGRWALWTSAGFLGGPFQTRREREGRPVSAQLGKKAKGGVMATEDKGKGRAAGTQETRGKGQGEGPGLPSPHAALAGRQR